MNITTKIQNLQGTDYEIVVALWQMKTEAERAERQLYILGRTTEAEIKWGEVLEICAELRRMGHWKALANGKTISA